MPRYYLDYAATSPLGEAARQAMSPWLQAQWGNPSSLHQEGRRAKDALDQTREKLSQRLGCLFAEIAFTSGGTEACNLAILGTALKRGSGGKIVMSAVEHPAVRDCQETLLRLGVETVLVPVDATGAVDLNAWEQACDPQTILACLMHANNETGTLQPLSRAAEITKKQNIPLFIDACQTFCKMPWTVADLGADLVAVSAQKIGGPQGAGALFVRAGTPLAPMLLGGGQERELRSGTENVAAIAGFGAAIEDYGGLSEGLQFRKELTKLADVVWTLEDSCPHVSSIQHCRFPGIRADVLLIRLDREGLAASAGAACGAGSIEPSPVLLAMGMTETEAREGVRFSFGPGLSAEEISGAARLVADTVAKIREAQR